MALLIAAGSTVMPQEADAASDSQTGRRKASPRRAGSVKQAQRAAAAPDPSVRSKTPAGSADGVRSKAADEPAADPAADPAAPSGTDAIRLSLDPNIATQPRPATRNTAPTFGTAERLQLNRVGEHSKAVLSGNAELRRRGVSVRADQITFDDEAQVASATGDVEIVRGNLRMRGPQMQLQLDTGQGFFQRPHYQLGGRGRGQADRIDIIDDNRLRMHNATFTSCRVDQEDWRLEAERIDIDRSQDSGTGRSARLRFKDLTLLSLPVLYFPLSDERKTGLLPPSVVTSSTLGFEYQQPLYVNIAPNVDYTLISRLSSRRGLRLGNELRYLFPNVRGSTYGDYVPDDRVTRSSRWSVRSLNQINNVAGWNGAVNLSGVSDDNYFVDYAGSVLDASQRSLPRDAFITRPIGDWSVLGRVTTYQNILDMRLAPPYERVPQLQLSTFRPDVGGFELGLLNDVSWFRRPLADAVEGMRAVIKPSISYPVRGASWFVTPKLIGNLAYYDLKSNPNGPTSFSRFVPTFSFDSGMVFERPTSFAGRALIQTLEPRIYYLYTPYHDQSRAPVFDSANMDFDFPQIFYENRYTGNDRIADSNLVTAGLTSRFYDQETGAERLALAAAQRFYFSPQRVTIPGQPANTDRKSDLLFGAKVVLRRGLSLGTGVQYSLQNSRVPRYSASVHYWPGNGRILNLGVHYQSQVYGQFDASFQWPVARNWSVLGKVNHSFLNSQVDPATPQSAVARPGLVEGVAGVEYTQDCWAARFVVQRYVTTARTYTNALFVQLDLKGFGRAGPDPFSILVRTIQGYRVPTASTAAPTPGYYGY